MRKVTSEAVEALMNGQNYKCGNTKVENQAMYLHGNKIAWRVKGMLFISNCGYFTAVTKERLNELPNVTIQQIKGEWYLNGKHWDGRAIRVRR